jgi:hypothetical protein
MATAKMPDYDLKFALRLSAKAGCRPGRIPRLRNRREPQVRCVWLYLRNRPGRTTFAWRRSSGKSLEFRVMTKSALPCSAQWQNASSLGSGEISTEDRTLTVSARSRIRLMTFPMRVGRTRRRFRTCPCTHPRCGDEPNEVVLLCPPVEYIGTRVTARSKRLSEARNAGHEHAGVNDHTRLAALGFQRQR